MPSFVPPIKTQGLHCPLYKKLLARSIRPKFPEISDPKWMDRFGPTGNNFGKWGPPFEEEHFRLDRSDREFAAPFHSTFYYALLRHRIEMKCPVEQEISGRSGLTEMKCPVEQEFLN